jgi:hypothetical protein
MDSAWRRRENPWRRGRDSVFSCWTTPHLRAGRMNGVVDATIIESRGASAAADEVDDFEAVAVFEDGLRPAVAGGNFAVEFDGYAVGLHSHDFHKGR